MRTKFKEHMGDYTNVIKSFEMTSNSKHRTGKTQNRKTNEQKMQKYEIPTKGTYFKRFMDNIDVERDYSNN